MWFAYNTKGIVDRDRQREDRGRVHQLVCRFFIIFFFRGVYGVGSQGMHNVQAKEKSEDDSSQLTSTRKREGAQR